MKQWIIVCFAVCIAFHINAQTVSIYDQVTHQPVPWATLQCSATGNGVISDISGRADISAFRNCSNIEIRCVGFATVTISYQQLEQKGYKLYLAEDKISLNTVVISANKWTQPRSEVPVKTLVISKNDVLLLSPQTAADMISLSGGVFVQKSQLGGGSPMIRGFATNRLLISVDGVRMNNAIFRSGNLQNIISVDPFVVDKAEVVFGPGSVIYGSDAIAGTMNFFTYTPMLSITNEPYVNAGFTGRFSSANFEKTGHAHVNVGFRKFASFTSFSFTDFDDLIMGAAGPEEYLRKNYAATINGSDTVLLNSNPRKQVGSAYSQYNLLQKFRFMPSDKWDINYSFYYSATSDYGRYDRLVRPKGNTLRSAEWFYGPQVWMMNHLAIFHNAKTKISDKLAIHLSYQLFEESRFDRDLNKSIRHERFEKVHALTANIDLEKQFGEHHQLLYGADFVFNIIRSSGKENNVFTGESEVGPSRYPDNSDWASMALYVSYRYKLNDKLSMQIAGRYNYFMLDALFESTFYAFPFSEAHLSESAPTGSLGLVYSPSQSWQFIGNVSSGFRTPNIDDIGKVFDSEPGSVIVPNPELKPEYAYNVDLSVIKTFGDFLKLDITGYYTYLDNAMVRRNSTLNGQDSIFYDGEMSQVQSLQNAAYATVYGVQGGIEIKLPFRLGISAFMNYQKGSEELDDGTTAPLRHAAPFFGSAHLTYTYNRVKLDFYSIFNSKVSYENLAPEEKSKDYIYAFDEDGNPYSPAWYTLNLKAMYLFSDNFSMSAGIENIANIRYRPYSSGICAPGRNLVVSVMATF